MKAKLAQYEKKVLNGKSHVLAYKYLDLQNLPHWHMECELVFSESGETDVMVGNTVYRLTPGRSVYIRSGEIHYIKSEKDSVVSVIKIDPELISGSLGNRAPVCPYIENRYPFYPAFDDISRESISGKDYSEAICDSIIIRLLAEIFRGERTEEIIDRTDGSSEKYKKLLGMIDEQFAYITFDEAADFMCFSRPYFSKYFQRMSGMTFTSYLNVVRVGKAVQMLTEKSVTATQAAQSTGFGTIRSFNRVFKELTGYTPKNLPNDYAFIRSETGGLVDSDPGFDPTLSSSVRL